MNGKYLLDTNALIALLDGHSGLSTVLSSANWIGISIISELEFLSFSGITASDKALFQQFKSRVEVLDLYANDISMINAIVTIRQSNKVKLPDAIIAAGAILQGATLLSNDVGFKSIPGLLVQNFLFIRGTAIKLFAFPTTTSSPISFITKIVVWLWRWRFPRIVRQGFVTCVILKFLSNYFFSQGSKFILFDVTFFPPDTFWFFCFGR